MKAFCGKGIVGLGGRELINAGVEFRSKSKLRIQSLYGCGNAIGKVAYLKERTHREPHGKHFNATRMLIVGEHGGVFFSQRPVAQTPSIAAKDRVYVVVDLLELNHQLQNGVAWTGSIISPLFSLPTPIQHFHS